MNIVLAPFRFLFLILLISLVAVAAWADDNQVGLFYDSDAVIAEIEVTPNSTHSLYLVLLNPVNDSYEDGGSRDVDFVGGFECAVEIPTGDILLDLTLAVPGVNVGGTDDIRAGFGTPVPVSGERAATLATFSVLTMGNNPEGYRLTPYSTPSRANAMAYVDNEDTGDMIVKMVPVSGAFERPVFTFGDYTIDENAKWGEVKALFR